jgi:hypothetical protein
MIARLTCSRAILCANAKPRPLEPPVIMTVCPAKEYRDFTLLKSSDKIRIVVAPKKILLLFMFNIDFSLITSASAAQLSPDRFKHA